ncbi:MAG: hypothetical protein IIC79_06100 [Chloroflexi bacterium]|nr:hypothetical protein [Chloroflexota bacterium]
MKAQIPDFYLASAEGYGFDEPRKCYRIMRVQSEMRDDYMLIRVDPPLTQRQHGLAGVELDTIVIATRHKGSSLFPILEWPVYVHIARLHTINPSERDIIHPNEIESIAWGELYLTEEDALNSIV